VSDTVEPIETLGQRLSRQAARMMSARVPTFGWLAPLTTLLDHLESLPGPTAGRFDRIEAIDAPVDFHDRLPGSRAAASDDADAGAADTAEGRALPSDVAAQARRVVGQDVSALRVHDDRAADAFARTHRAEAVTVGRDVYFRQGRFRPREPEGFGLVAHEATHVAEALASGAALRRLTRGGRDDEERRAEAIERRASRDGARSAAVLPSQPPGFGGGRAQLFTGVGGARSVPSPTARPRPAPHYAAMTTSWPASPENAASSQALQPMTAAEDRTVDTPPQLDLEALQRSLLDDLKRQLRSEFERGA
jgi:hypothetical protein